MAKKLSVSVSAFESRTPTMHVCNRCNCQPCMVSFLLPSFRATSHQGMGLIRNAVSLDLCLCLGCSCICLSRTNMQG